MATSTDVPIYTTTLSTAAASVTIPLTDYQQYKNLKIVATANHDGTGSGVNQWRMQFNGDSTSGLYSDINIYGNGSTAGSNRDSNQNFIYCGLVGQTSMTYSPVSRFHIMNYSNSSMHKTVLVRGDAAGQAVYQTAGLWRNTSAVTSVTLFMTGQNLKAGSTISVYGIGSASIATKATGGIISQDDDYIYHTFASTGTFTPTQNLTNVDYLVVAGGGGSQPQIAGGGGAGGLRTTVGTSGGGASAESKISLNNGTSYTISVGAGGSGFANGTDSYISGTGLTTITSVGGGRGGKSSSTSGASGGSGGGGGASEVSSGDWAGGSGTSGQGFAGANGKSGSSSPVAGHTGAGGGGAGEAAPAPTAGSLRGGNGILCAIDNTYRGGGGGGGSQYMVPPINPGGLGGGGTGGGYYIVPTNGLANTGGGGGGGGYGGAASSTTSNGGSGIVIVRYAK